MATGLNDYGAALQRCIQALEGAQGALGVARDRADGAAQALMITTDGSNNDLIAQTIAIVAQADQAIEALGHGYVQAIENIRQYAMEKGLG